MAIVTGAKTVYHNIPNGTSFSISHTHLSGADGLLIVSSAHANSASITGMTYNGVAMTQLVNMDVSTQSIRHSFFYIKNPTVGTYDITTTFSGPQFNYSSFQCTSYTGSDIGNFINTADSLSSPVSQAITVSANSLIYARGVSPNSFTQIDVAGTIYTSGFEPNNVNINKITSGGYSGILTAGSKNVAMTTTSGYLQMIAVEVKEVGGLPPSTNTNFLIMF